MSMIFFSVELGWEKNQIRRVEQKIGESFSDANHKISGL
jgi:hypothetical protein